MGFIGGSSVRELDMQNDLPDPDPIDEIDYELEFELAAEECEPESSFEDDVPDHPDAIPANNPSDLFEFFFREQARLAFLNLGNSAYSNNGIRQSNDRFSAALFRDQFNTLRLQLQSRLHQQFRRHRRWQLHWRPYHLQARYLQALQGVVTPGDGVLWHGIRTHDHLV